MEQAAVIQVNNLCKAYGATRAVDGISFEVQRGEIFGVIGPNGAGKTTTIEILTGLRQADSGQVRVLGLDPAHQTGALREQIGIQLQSAALPEELLVWEALDLFAAFYRRPANWKELAVTWGLANKLNSRYANLSGGQKQRLMIALALVNNPQLVFLDELTTGLDPQARRNTWEMIEQMRAQGKTVLLVTHFMEEAERLCDRVAIIDHGKLAALGSPAALIQTLGQESRVRFALPARFDPRWFDGVPGIQHIARQNGDVLVSGQGALLAQVAGALAAQGIYPADLRSEQPALEDVFLSLAGRQIRTEEA